MSGHFSCFLGSLFLDAVMDVTMMKYPNQNKKLMVGENLELEWRFNVTRITDKQWSISLFVYNFTSKSKIRIFRRRETGIIARNPDIQLSISRRLNYSFPDCICYAKLQLLNTNFEDSAGYGISFETINVTNDQSLEKVTEVLIVGKSPNL